MDKKRKVTSDIKPKRKWNKFENENSEANGKAIYCIFNGVNLSNSKGLQYLNILDNVFLFEYQLVCNM